MHWVPVLWAALIFAAIGRNAFHPIGVGIMAVVVVVAVIGFLVLTRRSRRPIALALHERGLALGEGASRREAPWDDIDLVYVATEYPPVIQIVPIGQSVRLTFRSGGSAGLYKLPGMDVLIRTLAREVSMPQLAEARAALAAGEPLTFGPITLDRRGIRVGSDRIAWETVTGARFDLDRVRVMNGRHVWGTVALGEIPHCVLMVALLRDRVQVDTDLPFFVTRQG